VNNKLKRIWKEAAVLFWRLSERSQTTKILDERAGVPAEIRAELFLNISLKRCHYITRPRQSKCRDDQSPNIPFDIHASLGLKNYVRSDLDDITRSSRRYFELSCMKRSSNYLSISFLLFLVDWVNNESVHYLFEFSPCRCNYATSGS
jgi:hypothetical protein